MERQQIIDLVREHYDPEPRDWPRHRGWDDGAEKIADEILKLSVLRGLEVARMLNPVEACPECGLKSDALLHKFCTHSYNRKYIAAVCSLILSGPACASCKQMPKPDCDNPACAFRIPSDVGNVGKAKT